MIADKVMATVSAFLLALFFAVEAAQSFKENAKAYGCLYGGLACLFIVATLINISMF